MGQIRYRSLGVSNTEMKSFGGVLFVRLSGPHDVVVHKNDIVDCSSIKYVVNVSVEAVDIF